MTPGNLVILHNDTLKCVVFNCVRSCVRGYLLNPVKCDGR